MTQQHHLWNSVHLLELQLAHISVCIARGSSLSVDLVDAFAQSTDVPASGKLANWSLMICSLRIRTCATPMLDENKTVETKQRQQARGINKTKKRTRSHDMMWSSFVPCGKPVIRTLRKRSNGREKVLGGRERVDDSDELAAGNKGVDDGIEGTNESAKAGEEEVEEEEEEEEGGEEEEEELRRETT